MDLKVWDKNISEGIFRKCVKDGFSAQQIANVFKISRPTAIKISKKLSLYDELIENGKKRRADHCRTVRLKNEL